MHEIEHEILRAAAELKLPPEALRKCAESETEHINRKTRDIFVNGNPRSWWLSPKLPCVRYDYSSGGVELVRSHIPDEERSCWLIPETEEERLPVFDCDTDRLTDVLQQCFFFEYYVVGKRFNWLIADTDHNQIMVCRSNEHD